MSRRPGSRRPSTRHRWATARPPTNTRRPPEDPRPRPGVSVSRQPSSAKEAQLGEQLGVTRAQLAPIWKGHSRQRIRQLLRADKKSNRMVLLTRLGAARLFEVGP